MAGEKLNLSKKVYAKNQYEKVINTDFSQLATSPTSTTTRSTSGRSRICRCIFHRNYQHRPHKIRFAVRTFLKPRTQKHARYRYRL